MVSPPAIRRTGAVLAAASGALLLILVATASGTATRAAGSPLVRIELRGGLCPGGACGETTVIGERTITSRSVTKPGAVRAAVRPADRLRLEHAIAALDVRRLRPFRGVCPTVADGPEWIYRFRGVARPLSTCRYDLRGVAAVVLADRIAATVR